jgi:hypothetical protein
MRAISASAVGRPRKIEGHSYAGRVKFGPRKFSDVAKVLWRKPAASIAAIEQCSLSTAKRILRGRTDISGNLLLAVQAEMLRPRD